MQILTLVMYLMTVHGISEENDIVSTLQHSVLFLLLTLKRKDMENMNSILTKNKRSCSYLDCCGHTSIVQSVECQALAVFDQLQSSILSMK